MHVQLRLSMNGKTRTVTVEGPEYLIGRSRVCQLQPMSASVSRKHCMLIISESRVMVHDLHSRHGTFVNDAPVKGVQQLQSGDVLRVANVSFTVSIEGDESLENASQDEHAVDAPALAIMTDAVQPTADEDDSDVDVSEWLVAADDADRAQRKANSHLRLADLGPSDDGEETQVTNFKQTTRAQSAEDSDARVERKLGRLPKKPKPMAKDSTVAAQRALAQAELRRRQRPV